MIEFLNKQVRNLWITFQNPVHSSSTQPTASLERIRDTSSEITVVSLLYAAVV